MSGLSNLWSKLARSRKYREAFVAAQLKRGIPTQMRALLKQREWSQAELAERSGLTQGAISRAADPDYGNLTFNTVLKIAAGFDIAFVGKFVPFSELASWHDSITNETTLMVDSFDEDTEPQTQEASFEAALAAHVAAPAPLDWHSDYYANSVPGTPIMWNSLAGVLSYSEPGTFIQKWYRNMLSGGMVSNSFEGALSGYESPVDVNPPVDIGWYRAAQKGPSVETAIEKDLYDTKPKRA